MKKIGFGCAVAVFLVGVYAIGTGIYGAYQTYQGAKATNQWLSEAIGVLPDGKTYFNRSAVLNTIIQNAVKDLQRQAAAPSRPAVATPPPPTPAPTPEAPKTSR